MNCEVGTPDSKRYPLIDEKLILSNVTLAMTKSRVTIETEAVDLEDS